MALRALIVVVVAAALSTHCGNGRPPPPGIRDDPRLRAAADCASLTQKVQDLATQEMRAILEATRDMGPVYYAPAAAGATAPPPASYSTTNIQVAGVDEADFVKNDGTRIFAVANGALWAARSWPPEDLALAGRLAIEGFPQSMFLDGDRVVVLSTVWTQAADATPGAGFVAMHPCPLFSDICFGGDPATKITVVDVSSLAAPAVVAEFYVPGWTNDARRIGSTVVAISNDGVRWPKDVSFWPGFTGDDRDSAISALEDRNEAIIRKTPIESWFPPGARKLASGATVDLEYRCSDFYLPDAPERLGLATIATVDLDRLDAGVSRTSIVGLVSQIHATPTTLYLATEHFWWWQQAGQRDFTYLHRFDISDPSRPAYVASGGVEGHLADQFALDDRGGNLRVAATTSTWLADLGGRPMLGNHVAVLGLRGEGASRRLSVVGDTGILEDGERIFASRFLGDKGFVVTFRSVDPLVTVDLSDPAHPRKVAELTEPGFSTLLQPIDDDHLLALGIDLPDPDAQGRVDQTRRAVKLSLYDVSDLSRPRRTSLLLVGTAWGWTAALWDHHAFNWYPQRGLLGLPFSDWIEPRAGQSWYDGFVSDLRVFSVDVAAGIAPRGAVSMADVYLLGGTGAWTSWYRPWVTRSVLATDQNGNDFVYAVSDAGIRSAALRDPGRPLATVLYRTP